MSSSRTIAKVMTAADAARDAEREFVDALLDRLESVVENLDHEIANLRSVGQEDDARAVEDAMRPLRLLRLGVLVDG